MKVRNIRNCSRCDGNHDEIEARPLTFFFAPPEANGLKWTHWAPCPSNGEPILFMVGIDRINPTTVARFSSTPGPGVRGLYSMTLGHRWDRVEIECSVADYCDPRLHEWIKDFVLCRLPAAGGVLAIEVCR